MNERKIVGYSALCIAVAAHVLAYLGYDASRNSITIPSAWERDFLILLSFSLILALIQHLLAGYLLRAITIFLRVVVINLIGAPFGGNLLILSPIKDEKR